MTIENLELGQTGQLVYKDHIRLISDRGNLSHESKVALPQGLEVTGAQLRITRQEYTTNQGIRRITQPGLFSIGSDKLVSIKQAVDEAQAEAKFKKLELFGFGKLKSALDTISLRQMVDASTHAEIEVHAWADGRRYSSKDGVIIADLVIDVVRRPTSDDVADLVTKVIELLDQNSQETLDKAIGSVRSFAASAKEVDPRAA